ncbi:uncharacterized protein L3040_003972 [Drepanopeziza brunnea f. sp. 'multigermtubi']|nr:hypothetical protein L3040_003972 [Drepanopeziza brunnea f. sp. 'multigermtubi']
MTYMPYRKAAIFLKCSPEPFKIVNALRATLPANVPDARKIDPVAPIPPYVALFRRLPTSLLSTYQEALTDLASQRKPFEIEVGAPYIYIQNLMGNVPKSNLYSIGFQLPMDAIESLRKELYKGFEKELTESRAKSGAPVPRYTPMNKASLLIRNSAYGLTRSQAEEALGQLQRDYKNGLGKMQAEGFAFQERAEIQPPSKRPAAQEYMFTGA